MNSEKKIVCLANSWRDGGRCIAGKEIAGNGYGGWIRPINTAEQPAIPKYKKMTDGAYPRPLDIIHIPLFGHAPDSPQKENYLVAEWGWRKEGTVDWDELDNLVDEAGDELWRNKISSKTGLNDQVDEKDALNFGHSLLLVRPNKLKIKKQYDSNRAIFSLGDHQYNLKVTDTMMRKEGIYDNIYLCISLAGPYQYHLRRVYYKLVAAIMTNAK